jgi:predicted transcriptional regulator
MTSQQPTSLVERTRSLLRGAPRELTYTAMAKATGVSVAWISRFADDKIPNPGVNQVQAIFDYLSGRVA